MKKTTQSSELSSLEYARKADARELWFGDLINRLGRASGVDVVSVLGHQRIAGILAELHVADYPYAKAQEAEAWILRGWPTRKPGELTTADFFPTDRQLAEVEYVAPDSELDAIARHGAELRSAHEFGRLAGIAEEAARWNENAEYLRLQNEARPYVDIAQRTAQLDARETELNEYAERLAKREEMLQPIIRKMQRMKEPPPDYIDPRRVRTKAPTPLSDALGNLDIPK